MDEELGSVPVLQYVGCWDHAYYGYYCPLTVNLKHEWFKRKAIQEGNTVPTQGGASNLTTSDPRPSGGVGYNGVNNSTGSFQSPATPRRYSEEEGTVVVCYVASFFLPFRFIHACEWMQKFSRVVELVCLLCRSNTRFLGLLRCTFRPI